jgi:hypothetical protein
MSFDLYFYKRKNSTLTEEQIAEYLTENLCHNIADYDRQWHYENPETGVYFIIDWNTPEDDPESMEIFDDFVDHQNLNFSCSINFFRPRFFGYEIFPIIEKFINDLDLYVLDLQDTEEPNYPKKFPAGYIQDEWIRLNDRVTLDQFSALNFEYLPLEKSNYLWEFQFCRDSFQNSLTEDLFVSGYFILKSKENEQLYTACVWPTHISIIIPTVDFLIVKKVYRKFFKTMEETGLISYDTVLKEFASEFEDYPHEIPNLKVFRNTGSDKIKKKFNALKLGMTASEFGSGISFDNFVNVRP